ncbi:virulence protein E [Spirosoma sp. KCTC 42546]|uniref:VapE domain-containing protein n=1 Tax=Spirosoma sp. KCTC 42546 TaxID=2520506 RepID=UPI00115B4A84|nr:VapE domain-containing protein [Spirosoma sp. KCTC 42546]QDK77765.1 virulence protein E [Spirosoma sp. KCTC 42546]
MTTILIIFSMAKIDQKKYAPSEQIPIITRIQDYLSERYAFRLDIVANVLQYKSVSSTCFREMNESNLLKELYEIGFNRFKDQLKALLKSDFIPEYDPFKAYFEGLPSWDETQPDYIAELLSYVKVKDADWFAIMFKKMLIRSVACAIGVAKFNKQCFVLYGPQDDGKTSFLRFLCPPALKDYYKENIDFENKDGRIALGENFLINLDELSSLSKSDTNKFKAYLTEERVKVRRPYAERETIIIRRASFLGSTNQNEFLTDVTGNVRWLVFETNSINHDKGGPKGYSANVDINNVWAQAYALLKSGFQYQLTREELARSEGNNRQHQRTTAEIDLINHYFQPADKTTPKAEFLTATEIARRLTILIEGKVRVNDNNVGKALTLLGYQQLSVRRAAGAFPVKGYWVVQVLAETKFQ